ALCSANRGWRGDWPMDYGKGERPLGTHRAHGGGGPDYSRGHAAAARRLDQVAGTAVGHRRDFAGGVQEIPTTRRAGGGAVCSAKCSSVSVDACGWSVGAMSKTVIR